jgi:hypothetical protein
MEHAYRVRESGLRGPREDHVRERQLMHSPQALEPGRIDQFLLAFVQVDDAMDIVKDVERA